MPDFKKMIDQIRLEEVTKTERVEIPFRAPRANVCIILGVGVACFCLVVLYCMDSGLCGEVAVSVYLAYTALATVGLVMVLWGVIVRAKTPPEMFELRVTSYRLKK